MPRTPYFARQAFFGQLLAVEIGHLARADDIELQNIESVLDEGLDLRFGEIDFMHLLAIGAAAQLPQHGEAFFARSRGVEIVGKLEQAVEKPLLPVAARRLSGSLRRGKGRA